jgi:hypothetical protein
MLMEKGAMSKGIEIGHHFPPPNTSRQSTFSRSMSCCKRPRVGGVRSSDDPAPDLWFGQPAGERRDATCSAARKHNEELVTARKGYKRRECSGVATPRWHHGFWPRCKELGKPDAGKPPVRFDDGREADGHWPSGLSIRRFPPTLHSILLPWADQEQTRPSGFNAGPPSAAVRFPRE